MLSLLTQRVALRTSTLASLAICRSKTPSFALRTVTRTFLTTPEVAYPPKAAGTAASTKAASATKAKAPATKAATKKPATKAAAEKKSSEKPAAGEKPKSTKIVLKKGDYPPKQPPSAYLLFFMQTQKERGTIDLASTAAVAKEAGAKWKTMSDAEKQPFFDQRARLWEEYSVAKANFDKTVPYHILRELNRRRAARGKKGVHRKSTRQYVIGSYIRFSAEFLPEFLRSYVGSPGEKRSVTAVKAAAEKWRNMSAEEKAPYIQAYEEDKAKLASAST